MFQVKTPLGVLLRCQPAEIDTYIVETHHSRCSTTQWPAVWTAAPQLSARFNVRLLCAGYIQDEQVYAYRYWMLSCGLACGAMHQG